MIVIIVHRLYIICTLLISFGCPPIINNATKLCQYATAQVYFVKQNISCLVPFNENDLFFGTQLNLYSNLIQNFEPTVFDNIRNLTTYISFQKNLLKAVIHHFQNLPALIELNLSNNIISFLGAAAFKGCPSLSELDLSRNMITCADKASGWNSLTAPTGYVYLQNNPISLYLSRSFGSHLSKWRFTLGPSNKSRDTCIQMDLAKLLYPPPGSYNCTCGVKGKEDAELCDECITTEITTRAEDTQAATKHTYNQSNNQSSKPNNQTTNQANKTTKQPIKQTTKIIWYTEDTQQIVAHGYNNEVWMMFVLGGILILILGSIIGGIIYVRWYQHHHHDHDGTDYTPQALPMVVRLSENPPATETEQQLNQDVNEHPAEGKPQEVETFYGDESGSDPTTDNIEVHSNCKHAPNPAQSPEEKVQQNDLPAAANEITKPKEIMIPIIKLATDEEDIAEPPDKRKTYWIRKVAKSKKISYRRPSARKLKLKKKRKSKRRHRQDSKRDKDKVLRIDKIRVNSEGINKKKRKHIKIEKKANNFSKKNLPGTPSVQLNSTGLLAAFTRALISKLFGSQSNKL